MHRPVQLLNGMTQIPVANESASRGRSAHPAPSKEPPSTNRPGRLAYGGQSTVDRELETQTDNGEPIIRRIVNESNFHREPIA